MQRLGFAFEAFSIFVPNYLEGLDCVPTFPLGNQTAKLPQLVEIFQRTNEEFTPTNVEARTVLALLDRGPWALWLSGWWWGLGVASMSSSGAAVFS